MSRIFLRDTTGAQDSFRFRVFHDLLTGADTAPPFYFLRAHHLLTRNRHAPPFAEYITSYGLHPPNDRRRAESVCAYRPRHCKRSGCGTNEFFTSTLRHRFIPRRFRTRFFYRMVHPRINRRLRRTGLCGGVRAYEPCGTDRTTFQPVGEMWSPLWGRTLPPCRRARRSVRFFGSENSRPDTRFNPASAPYTYRPGCERPYPHGNRHDRYESGKSCSRNHVTTHESRLYVRSDRFPHRQWVRRPYRLARS